MEVVHIWLDYEGLEWTSKLHEEVAQIPMVSTTIAMPSHASKGMRSVLYNQLTKEFFWLGTSLMMVLHTMQAPSRSGQLQHGNSFWANPERHQWRVIFTVGRKNFRQYTWPYICLEWEMTRHRIVHCFGLMLKDCLDSQSLGKSDWKIGEKDIGGKEMWMNLSKWVKGIKILCLM